MKPHGMAPEPPDRALLRRKEPPLSTFADMFCGIGAFHYAAASLGLRCVFACDIDQAAQRQYEHNFGMRPEGDITKIHIEDIPTHDILFAGFPCQPFSIIGKMEAMSDSRGTLIYDVARILAAKSPKAFVLENVRQLATINKGKTLRLILNALEEIGYACSHKILNALRFGLPQKRERLIIAGFLDREAQRAFQWPRESRQYAPLSEILESDPDPRHVASQRIREKRKAAHTPAVTPSIWHENKGGNISSHPFSCALRAGASYNYLLVNGERRLTPRELLRLQGFPESFEVAGNDSQIRKQAGNAVPVPLVKAVIESVIHATHATSFGIQEHGALSAEPVPASKREQVRNMQGKAAIMEAKQRNGEIVARPLGWEQEGTRAAFVRDMDRKRLKYEDLAA